MPSTHIHQIPRHTISRAVPLFHGMHRDTSIFMFNNRYHNEVLLLVKTADMCHCNINTNIQALIIGKMYYSSTTDRSVCNTLAHRLLISYSWLENNSPLQFHCLTSSMTNFLNLGGFGGLGVACCL
jgi:hypothetical protein